MENKIYLDNAATTKTRPEVVEAMLPYFTEKFGNPSSIYEFASQNRKAVDEARGIIAKSLGADISEIYFTAGGTESDNWALKETFDAYASKGNHIITSKIEHHAILHTCEYLEKHGCEVTYVDVDENGVIKLDQLKKAIRPTTILISVMFANNEIGTIQPIKEIGEIAKQHNILFHTDAVQAYGQLPIDVNELGIDMLSASAHKLHGPKGIGFLYIRKGAKLHSLIHGGAQERQRRAGTENVPGIVGLGKAAELARKFLPGEANIATLRDRLENGILKQFTNVSVNGNRNARVPNTTNVGFEYIEGEAILLYLNEKGIAASSGSACSSGSLEPSHVLRAMGVPFTAAHGSIRFSLSRFTTAEEVDYTLSVLPEIINRLLEISPFWDKKTGTCRPVTIS